MTNVYVQAKNAGFISSFAFAHKLAIMGDDLICPSMGRHVPREQRPTTKPQSDESLNASARIRNGHQ